VLYKRILSEHLESGHSGRDRNIWREVIMKDRSFE